MKETQSFSELPVSVDLATAIDLNKDFWRRRDKTLSSVPAVEMPARIINPIFEKVIERFKLFVDPIHIKNLPLVGFSPVPDVILSWGHGDYRPDYDELAKWTLFWEFGTEWLANVVCDRDPFRMNCYTNKAIRKINHSKFESVEDVLLAGIIKSYSDKSISVDGVTNLFAKLLIAGDASDLKNIRIIMPDGEKINLSGRLYTAKKTPDDKPRMLTVEYTNPKSMELAKPFVRLIMKGVQTYFSLSRWDGNTSIPGVINVRGSKPEDVKDITIAHEFIHELGLHEDNVNGMPIKGYKLMGGVVLKKNGKP